MINDSTDGEVRKHVIVDGNINFSNIYTEMGDGSYLEEYRGCKEIYG